jgi:hypothetical protein
MCGIWPVSLSGSVYLIGLGTDINTTWGKVALLTKLLERCRQVDGAISKPPPAVAALTVSRRCGCDLHATMRMVWQH